MLSKNRWRLQGACADRHTRDPRRCSPAAAASCLDECQVILSHPSAAHLALLASQGLQLVLQPLYVELRHGRAFRSPPARTLNSGRRRARGLAQPTCAAAGRRRRLPAVRAASGDALTGQSRRLTMLQGRRFGLPGTHAGWAEQPDRQPERERSVHQCRRRQRRCRRSVMRRQGEVLLRMGARHAQQVCKHFENRFPEVQRGEGCGTARGAGRWAASLGVRRPAHDALDLLRRGAGRPGLRQVEARPSGRRRGSRMPAQPQFKQQPAAEAGPRPRRHRRALENSHSRLHSGQAERVLSQRWMQSRWNTWPQVPHAIDRPGCSASPAGRARAWSGRGWREHR